MKFFIIIFLSIFTIVFSKPLDPKRVLYAVDCGSTTITKSSLGFIYQKDEGFTAGRIADYTTNKELANVRIKYTFDQNVYKTERHHDESFSYRIPLSTPGKYTLILKFAEMYFREPNKRVFNVKIGEKVVIKELDTVQKVGPFAANDEYVEVELRDEQIYVNGELCKGGYRANKQQFTVELEKLDRDLPNIVGLLLYDGGLEETDFNDLLDFRIQWQQKIDDEIRMEEEEKQRKINQKKKLLETLGDSAFEFEQTKEDRLSAMIRILSSKTGICIIGLLLSCVFFMNILGKDHTD